jgi:hypothetical protein
MGTRDHSDKVLQYSAENTVISTVPGQKPHRTVLSFTVPYCHLYCSIVRKMPSLELQYSAENTIISTAV